MIKWKWGQLYDCRAFWVGEGFFFFIKYEKVVLYLILFALLEDDLFFQGRQKKRYEGELKILGSWGTSSVEGGGW